MGLPNWGEGGKGSRSWEKFPHFPVFLADVPKSFSAMIFKIWPFSHCNSHSKNKKYLHNWGNGSMILKIVLWAHFTITHAMLSQSASQPRIGGVLPVCVREINNDLFKGRVIRGKKLYVPG